MFQVPLLSNSGKQGKSASRTLSLQPHPFESKGNWDSLQYGSADDSRSCSAFPVARPRTEIQRQQTTVLGQAQTPIFPELAALVESGKVLVTLYQRPEAQGKTAFETLIAHLTDKEKPVRSHRFAPHIILRSSLPLFAERLRGSAVS